MVKKTEHFLKTGAEEKEIKPKAKLESCTDRNDL